MTIQKITMDNSVKYIAQSEVDIKSNTIRLFHFLTNRRKKISENNKSFCTKISAEGFKIIK